ncbi:MAG: class I SAM-dependent RNA methyltransferase [Clostridia bacterium]|nr:class I SAM-dependent RNA methyltransferase [Clostridia bacterium]
MKLRMVATCLFGLEKLLGEEIDKIGGQRVETIDGRITFDGDETVLARANITLRCAERVFIWLGSFPVYSFDELFEGTKALPWERFIDKQDAFPVKGHAIRSRLYSVPDCQSIVKKAVVDRLSGKYGMRIFPETGVKYQIEFFIFKDVATLMIDTSGAPLHKRGYRPVSGEAPLRETLASAIASIARPREDVLFWDPFCGSGTIAIEAAMIAMNISPSVNRSFAAEDFPAIPSSVWQSERERANDLVIKDSKFEAYGSDIDREVLKKAEENARRAGVELHIKLFCADARKIVKPDGRKGTIACNPPYGERLMTLSEAEALYRDMGRAFERLSPWQIYVLTSDESFERLYGRRADKVRKLYNGMIPCRLYQYFKPQESRPQGFKKR